MIHFEKELELLKPTKSLILLLFEMKKLKIIILRLGNIELIENKRRFPLKILLKKLDFKKNK